MLSPKRTCELLLRGRQQCFSSRSATSCRPRSALNQQARSYSRSTPASYQTKEAIRERLREFGTPEDYVTFQLASELESPLSKLGTSTALVTLHNPASRNALTGQMMAQLADIVDQLEQQSMAHTDTEPLTTVILRGSHGFFCAGADLRIAKEHLLSTEGGHWMSTVMIDTLTRLRRLPMISVAAIDGGAVGGGAELATATDFRLVQHTASLRFVHAKMGLTPGWGGATRLVRLVGRSRALELLGSARKCSAEQCLAWGLGDRVVGSTVSEEGDNDSSSSEVELEDEEDATKTMDDALVKFVGQFVNPFPEVLYAAKAVVDVSANTTSLDEALGKEQQVFLELWGGEANRAALAAAAQKKASKS